jgi:hypothetical protein
MILKITANALKFKVYLFFLSLMYGDSDIGELSEGLSEDSNNSFNSETSQESSFSTELPLSYFNTLYFSKQDIKKKVETYHIISKKSFLVVQSDKRRYYVKCTDLSCSFKLQFNFSGNNFKSPDKQIAHTCNQLISISPTVSALANDDEVKSWFNSTGRNADLRGLKMILSRKGIIAKKHVMQRCIKYLKKTHFGEDSEQYKYLDSYIEVMNSKGHYTALEKNNNNFFRLCIVYLEGKECFKYYVDRGMQLDATFMKTEFGGTLMVSCFKDGNNNIRIIGIAIVSGENASNWSWFIEHLLTNLSEPPCWIISDRDRGLLNSVETFNIFHAYCFRHVLENFHLVFKNKSLKEKAWSLAKAKTINEFNMVKEWIVSIKPEAMEWLENIGLEHITILFSPVCRFGTVTSNNVESVNSRLRKARKLPIMEMLLDIENTVALDRFLAYKNSIEWTGNLTKYAESVLKKHIRTSQTFSFSQLSENIYRVSSPGPIVSLNQVDVENGSCTCGGQLAYKFPCVHMVFIFRQVGIDEFQFACDTWKRETYVASNRKTGQMGNVTMLQDLEKRNTMPPAIERRRGRPRLNRYPSQARDRVIRRRVRVNRCRNCRQAGHDRRNCPDQN